MTRPGQPMHSFLEGVFFDDERNLWLSDASRACFRISPTGDWTVEHRIDGEPHAMRIAPDGRRIAVDYRHGLIELTGHGTIDILSTGIDTRQFLGLRTCAMRRTARCGSQIAVAPA